MLNCRPARLYRNGRFPQTNAHGVVVQDESLKRKMENELAEGYKAEFGTELGCYLESAARFLPVEAERAAQQGTHMIA